MPPVTFFFSTDHHQRPTDPDRPTRLQKCPSATHPDRFSPLQVLHNHIFFAPPFSSKCSSRLEMSLIISSSTVIEFCSRLTRFVCVFSARSHGSVQYRLTEFQVCYLPTGSATNATHDIPEGEGGTRRGAGLSDRPGREAGTGSGAGQGSTSRLAESEARARRYTSCSLLLPNPQF